MKKIRIVAGVWLLGILFYLWGIATVEYKVFPWEQIAGINEEIKTFLLGHPDEPDTTPLQKMASDAGGVPYRYLIPDVASLEVPENANTFVINSEGLNLKGYHTNSFDGYILVSGAYNFEGEYNKGALLIDSHGNYIRHWRLDEVGVGITIDESENIILANNGLQITSWCSGGKEVPRKGYTGQHHSIEIAPDGTWWTHDDFKLIQLDPKKQGEDGTPEIIRSIDIVEDLVPLNNTISPLTTRFFMHWDKKIDPQKNSPLPGLLEDPFHNNDLQPFVDERFPTSLGYALLVSIREQNLILVLDPETKKILWYRQGLSERQHDVDYFEGSLYVYDNGPFRGYSRILRIAFDDPNDGSFGISTVVDGRTRQWFDPSRGQHDVISLRGERHHLVVNDRMGRVYLFDENQEPVFALQNFLPESDASNTGIQLRSALFIPTDQFNRLQKACNR